MAQSLIPREQVIALVDRVKALIAKHGGPGPHIYQVASLQEVIKWYRIYERRPDAFALIVLEKEIERAEAAQP